MTKVGPRCSRFRLFANVKPLKEGKNEPNLDEILENPQAFCCFIQILVFSFDLPET